MGLDMYLYGVKTEMINYDSKYDDGNKTGKTTITYQTVKTEEAYWRKCYFVDNWIVENVQEGVNDCDYHRITLDDLKELREEVKKILSENKGKLDEYNEYWFRYTVLAIDKLEKNYEELGYDYLEYRNSW